MKPHQIDRWLLMLAGLGLLASYFLFPKTYPFAGAQGTKSRSEILRQAEAVSDQLKFPREKLKPVIQFQLNRNLLSFGQATFGAAEANRLFARELPAFLWNVRYSEGKRLKNIRIDGFDLVKTFNDQYETQLQFDIHGRLLLLKLGSETKPDSLSLSLEEAKALALSLLPHSTLPDTGGFVPEKSEATFEKTRADYELTWKVPSPVAGLKAQLVTKIQGSRLMLWRLKYTPVAATYHSNRTLLAMSKVLTMLLSLFFIVLLFIFFIKKLRAEEISLKAGLPAAMIATLGLGVTIVFVGVPEGFFEWLLSILAVPVFLVFIFAVFLIMYGTGESLMRSVGHDRLQTFQAVQRGWWWFQPVGESLWRGAALGLILFGVVTLILNRLGPLVHSYLNPESEILPYYTAKAVPLFVLGENFCSKLFHEAFYRLFLISLLSRYFHKSWAIVGITAVISAVRGKYLLELEPFGLAFGIDLMLSLALTIIYLRFDFLATLTAALSLPLLLHGFSFLHAGKIVSPLNGWVILAMPLLFVAGGRLIRRFGRSEIDTQALLPDYLRRLAEKTRMKRELEIAREVQLNFLPRQMPAVAGLDIAALCAPALEVGGDYYDFVKFDSHRLGVLVGDVSGKGIPAAFYMTFTKAVIKSLAQRGLSPAQVLIQANKIFYQNAKRGTFISLTYGVFDLNERVFTLVRAGHNPILLMSQQQRHATLIEPKGMALGLEAGEIFTHNIEEQKLVINNGDVFVFYTDGFTEAMNGHHEEFGESRLVDVLSNGAGVASQATIHNFRNAVQIFSGETPQHDDMTMVVVRVL